MEKIGVAFRLGMMIFRPRRNVQAGKRFKSVDRFGPKLGIKR